MFFASSCIIHTYLAACADVAERTGTLIGSQAVAAVHTRWLANSCHIVHTQTSYYRLRVSYTLLLSSRLHPQLIDNPTSQSDHSEKSNSTDVSVCQTALYSWTERRRLVSFWITQITLMREFRAGDIYGEGLRPPLEMLQTFLRISHSHLHCIKRITDVATRCV